MKRLLSFLLCCLSLSSTAVAAVAHVKSQGAGVSNGGNSSFTFSYTPVGTGNGVLLSVGACVASLTITSLTPSATGWTFTQRGGIAASVSNCGQAAWTAYAPNTSAVTVTVTMTNSGSQTLTFNNYLIDEFSGVNATNFVDVSNSATGSGTPTVSVTPTASNDMIWCACNASVTAVGAIGGTTANKGADDLNQDWTEYRLLSGGSGSSTSCTFTSSGTYSIFSVGVKPPTGTVTHRLLLMGVGGLL